MNSPEFLDSICLGFITVMMFAIAFVFVSWPIACVIETFRSEPEVNPSETFILFILSVAVLFLIRAILDKIEPELGLNSVSTLVFESIVFVAAVLYGVSAIADED